MPNDPSSLGFSTRTTRIRHWSAKDSSFAESCDGILNRQIKDWPVVKGIGDRQYNPPELMFWVRPSPSSSQDSRKNSTRHRNPNRSCFRRSPSWSITPGRTMPPWLCQHSHDPSGTFIASSPDHSASGCELDILVCVVLPYRRGGHTHLSGGGIHPCLFRSQCLSLGCPPKNLETRSVVFDSCALVGLVKCST